MFAQIISHQTAL